MSNNKPLKALSRRTFLKLSALVGGTAALAGCSPEALDEDSGKETGDGEEFVEPTIEIEEGITVVPTAGTNNCGGRCVIKAHVKDDVIVRISTDEGSDEEFASTQIARACVR